MLKKGGDMLEENFFLTQPMIYFGNTLQGPEETSRQTEISFSTDSLYLDRTRVGLFMSLNELQPICTWIEDDS
ncbi:MAG: hypothetical protein HY324_01045 [Chlamydiia bacterium]|nr:hypothetical protein [Chlamydiia bacterium]